MKKSIGYWSVVAIGIGGMVSGGIFAVVMGDQGLGTLKSILLGGVTNKVVRHARGFTVTIVE